MLDLAIPLVGKPGNSAKFAFDCPVKGTREGRQPRRRSCAHAVAASEGVVHEGGGDVAEGAWQAIATLAIVANLERVAGLSRRVKQLQPVQNALVDA
jgi:hypothetical protein